MSPSAANTLLALILVALGFIGITLSFMVPDRKKSLISLVLAGIIVLVGVLQWGSQSVASFRLNRRMREIQRERQVDFDALRQKIRDQATGATPAPAKKP